MEIIMMKRVIAGNRRSTNIRRRGRLALAAAVCLAAGRAQSRAAQWDTPNSGDWSNGANWTSGSPPSPGDSVTNTYSSATISFDTNASVNSFNNSGSFTMNGGTLSGTQANSASPVYGGVTVNAGTLSSLTLVNITSHFLGTAALSSVNFSAGSIVFANQSSTAISGTSTFAADASISGGNLTLAPGALLVNSNNNFTFLSGTGTISGSGGASGGTFEDSFGSVNETMPSQTLTFASSLSSFQNLGNVQAMNGAVININAPFSNFANNNAYALIYANAAGFVDIPGTPSPRVPYTLPGTININSTLNTDGQVTSSPNGSWTEVGAFGGGTINIAGLWTGIDTTIYTSSGGTINVNDGMTGSFNFVETLNGLNITGGTIVDSQLVGTFSLDSNENLPFTGVAVLGQDYGDQYLQYNGLPANEQEGDFANITLNGSTLTINAGSVKSTLPQATIEGLLEVGTHAIIQGYGNILPGTLPASDSVYIDADGVLAASVSGQALSVGVPIINVGGIGVSPGAVLNITSGLTMLGGNVQCDGTLNFTGSSTLTFYTGKLTGDGVLNTNLFNTGRTLGYPSFINFYSTVSPGDTVGTLAINGNYTQSNLGIFDVALGGYGAGVNTGLLSITGSASLGGTIEVDLVNGFGPQIGDVFTVMTTGLGVTGAFANFTSNNGSLIYTVDYGLNDNIVEVTIVSVPEPRGVGLLSCGGVALLRRRRGKTGH
jgi:hypothetical protein